MITRAIADVEIYDKGVMNDDRITAVFNWDKHPRNGHVAMAVMSLRPLSAQGTYEHIYGRMGAHLGKRISYVDLDDGCARIIRFEIAEYNRLAKE